MKRNTTCFGIGVIAGASAGNELSKDERIVMQNKKECVTSTSVRYENRTTGWMVYVRVPGTNQAIPMVWNQGGGPYMGQQVNVGVEYSIVR